MKRSWTRKGEDESKRNCKLGDEGKRGEESQRRL